MNATFTTTTSTSVPSPNFIGMVRGEIFKLLHQRSVIITAIVVAAVFVVYSLRYALFFGVANNAGGSSVPTDGTVVYALMQLLFGDVRGLFGIFIMVATVSCIALEYQQGTIRVLLARGVGRLRLLGAKLTALGILSLAVLVALLILSAIMLVVDIRLAFGNINQLSNAPSYFMSDTLVGVLSLVINMVMTILFAAMFAVVGRSLAFGLGFTLPYFLVESILTVVLLGISAATHNDIWSTITTYFLGANLSVLSTALIPPRGTDILTILNRGTSALGPSIDAAHALLVTLVYFAIFVGVSGYLTWKRDVLQ